MHIKDQVRNILLLFIWIGGMTALAQETPYTISGTVIDAQTQQPLEGVYVSVVAVESYTAITTVQTGADGTYRIQFDKGNYLLSFYMGLYATEKKQIQYDRFTDRSYELPVVPMKAVATTTLDEVMITQKKYKLEKKNGKKIFTIPKGVGELAGSVSNLLSYIPTVMVDIEGAIKIRGQEPRVRINGRSSSLTKKEALQLLPSDMVKKIEVVTNPSASEGGGKPVINIITKKTAKKGLNGGINLGIGYPWIQKGGIHLTTRTDKWDLYGLYGVNNTNQLRSREQERLQEGTTTQHEDNRREQTGTTHFAELGYEFKPNSRSELVGNTSFFTDTHSIDFMGNRSIDTGMDTLFTEQSRDRDMQSFSFTQELEYEIELVKDRNELEIEVQYEYESSDKKEVFEETTTQTAAVDNSQSAEASSQSALEVETKFQQRIGENVTLSTGYELTTNVLDQDQDFEAATATSASTNDIRFAQNNHMGFVEYEQDIGNFEYRIGARLQHLTRELTSKTLGQTQKTTFTDLLPTVNVEYKISTTDEISAGYFKRVRYPRLRFLNNFNTSVDIQRIQVGNPDLQPQTEHNWELEYIKEFDTSTLIASLYGRHSQGIIQYETTNQDGITVTKPENIGSGTRYGAEIYYNFKPASWWYANIGTQAKYSKVVGVDAANSNTMYALDATLNNIFRWKPFKVELSWTYRSGRQETYQMRSQDMQFFKFGISRKVFKNKGNLVFSVTDPFQTRKQILTIEASDFQYEREYLARERQFMLSLFLRFQTKSKFRKTEKTPSKKSMFQ